MERRKESQQGKVKYHNETDVIRKTREIQKSKRRAVQLLRVAGPIRHKENKKQVQISFCVVSTACDFTNARAASISSGSPLRPPTDWQWKADKNYPPGGGCQDHSPFLFS